MQSIHRLLLQFGIILGALLQSDGLVASSCGAILTSPRAPVAGKVKTSAVEMELRLSEQLLSLLTTKDGTLGPLIKNGAVPGDLKQWYLANQNGASSVHEVQWDALPYDLKLSLVDHYSRTFVSKSFYDDRQIHALQTKSSIEVYLDKPISIFGRTYGVGFHQIQLRPYLEEKVEYRMESDLKRWAGVELHLRSHGIDAGSILESAEALETLLQVSRGPFHVHIIADVPSRRAKEQAEIFALEVTDYYRRVNIFAELLSISTGENVGTRVMDGVMYFSFLQTGNLRSLFNYIVNLTTGERDSIGEWLKDAWVAFRGSDKYEGQNPLWGLEFRSISRNSPVATYAPVLRQLERSFSEQRFGHTHDELVATFGGDAAGGIEGVLAPMIEMTYHQSWEVLWDQLPEWMREELESQDLDGLEMSHIERGERLKILLHDWSREPFLVSRPDLADLIQRHQLEGIKRILSQDSGDSELAKVVLQDFLANSGLLHLFGQSVGVHLQP